MMRLWATALVAAVTSCAATVFAEAGPFTFRIPEGWTDLSPGAPAANLERVPPALAAEARSRRFAAMAIDLDHVEDDFADNFNASVSPGDAEMTSAYVDTLAAELSRKAATTVLEAGTVVVGGVDWGRIVFQKDTGTRRLWHIVYLIPHGEADPEESSFATLTYTTTEARYPRAHQAFELAARATLGARPVQPVWRRYVVRARTAALAGAAAGMLAGVLAGIGFAVKRRRKPRQRAA
jgi:hypothetical protein